MKKKLQNLCEITIIRTEMKHTLIIIRCFKKSSIKLQSFVDQIRCACVHVCRRQCLKVFSRVSCILFLELSITERPNLFLGLPVIRLKLQISFAPRMSSDIMVGSTLINEKQETRHQNRVGRQFLLKHLGQGVLLLENLWLV